MQSAVGFVPTGWTYQMKSDQFPVHEKPPWKIHLIPYSEHSSFTELQEFVGFLRPKKILPTVGVSGEKTDSASHSMVKHFRNLCDNSGAKKAFLGRMIAAAENRVAKPCSDSGLGGQGAGTSITSQGGTEGCSKLEQECGNVLDNSGPPTLECGTQATKAAHTKAATMSPGPTTQEVASCSRPATNEQSLEVCDRPLVLKCRLCHWSLHSAACARTCQ
jgi:DNA repair metallo-beta-lactamase